MSIAQPPDTTPTLPDRSTRLMLFGIFQIVLGGLCGLGVLSSLAMATAHLAGLTPQSPESEAMTAGTMIPSIVFSLMLAVAFIWLGVGSIRARRWAWTLTVLLSWMWLITGAIVFVGFVFFTGPMMSARFSQEVNMPPQAIVVIQIITIAIMACIYILLPGVFLIFYHGKSVLATCQRRDPQIRWTDRCPMPVLALSILLAYSTVMWMPTAAIYGWVIPMFGIILSGVAGAAVILLLTLVNACLAWGAYRLQMAAWWGMLLLYIVGILSTVVTLSQMDLMELYEKMRIPESQLAMMRKSGMIEMMSSPLVFSMVLVCWIGLLGYLLYVRRYFVRHVEIR